MISLKSKLVIDCYLKLRQQFSSEKALIIMNFIGGQFRNIETLLSHGPQEWYIPCLWDFDAKTISSDCLKRRDL